MNGDSSTPCKSYFRLEGRVAIITGGASGIGAAAAQLFQENGAKVVIADVQDELGQTLAEKLGEDVCYIHCDVSNEDEIINLVDTAVAKYGKLDIMYNNAGIIDSNLKSLDTTKTDLERVLGVNTVGSFLGAKHAARVMVPRQSGCILFTSSACTAIAGILCTPSYIVSKFGIIGLVKSLAAELGQHGIRVNCVSPYALLSGMSRGTDPELFEAAVSRMGNLSGQVLKTEGVANAALYLASDEASYVNGVNLVVDGGFSVVNPTIMKSYILIK